MESERGKERDIKMDPWYFDPLTHPMDSSTLTQALLQAPGRFVATRVYARTTATSLNLRNQPL